MSTSTHVNAEAGPSTPRASAETPDTPTKPRRRSWFGLGSFGSTSTPPRASKEGTRDEGVELELDDRPAVGSRQSVGVNGQPAEGDHAEVLTIDAQPLGSPRRSKRRSGPPQDEGEVMALSDLGLRRQSSRSTVRPSDPGLRASTEGHRAEVRRYRDESDN